MPGKVTSEIRRGCSKLTQTSHFLSRDFLTQEQAELTKSTRLPSRASCATATGRESKKYIFTWKNLRIEIRMSSTAGDHSGIVVITQVLPQPKLLAHEQADERAKTATAIPRPLEKFFRGEPKALGVTQILTGIIQILFGIILTAGVNERGFILPAIIFTGVPFWCGIMYIVSGSLSVAASRNPAIRLIRASLGMNIVSAVASGIAIIIYPCTTVLEYRSYYQCSLFSDSEACNKMYNVHTTEYIGSMYMLLVFTILEFCVSISTSAFACKAVCRTAYSEVNVVIYQNTAPSPAVTNLSSSPPTYEEAKSL
ncbi:membrane-spanning 4-domains subfamily A member 4A-like isoform X1 [Rhinatrema bivittatum]|uniref:membrane-spanning 4-domains subfamily A member 4A-like isoform X1 n=1 Tax=Rhinatrema bivittatum TaxID=194408 RepID=UPI001129E9C4|nr:membrane-spanning 4-domains subfamily A member 4A-like isoform X1 [Rhinatrema bivittatum]